MLRIQKVSASNLGRETGCMNEAFVIFLSNSRQIITKYSGIWLYTVVDIDCRFKKRLDKSCRTYRAPCTLSPFIKYLLCTTQSIPHHILVPVQTRLDVY